MLKRFQSILRGGDEIFERWLDSDHGGILLAAERFRETESAALKIVTF